MPNHQNTPNGRCAVCPSPDRARVELLMATGAGKRALGRKFKLHFDAIGRHWLNHVTDERKAALAVGPVERVALAAQVCEESASVIDHHRAVRAGLYQLYDAALSAHDGNT